MKNKLNNLYMMDLKIQSIIRIIIWKFIPMISLLDEKKVNSLIKSLCIRFIFIFTNWWQDVTLKHDIPYTLFVKFPRHVIIDKQQ